jgi:hypothetical protein
MIAICIPSIPSSSDDTSFPRSSSDGAVVEYHVLAGTIRKPKRLAQPWHLLGLILALSFAGFESSSKGI